MIRKAGPKNLTRMHKTCILFFVYFSISFGKAQHDSDATYFDSFENVDLILDGSDPGKWMVYGSALGASYLGGAAELIIQPVDSDGYNISSLQIAHMITAVIDPPPAEPQMIQHNSGTIVLRFIWRQVCLRECSRTRR